MNAPAKKKSTASRNARIGETLACALKMGLSPLGKARQQTMLGVLSESLILIAEVAARNGKLMKFSGQSGWALYRGRSVLDKEPLTIRWIDGFEPDSIFWDIGANIGAYTVYAAATRGLKTYAFEPSAANFAVLCRNIELNGIDSLVTALPLAFSRETKIDTLHMISTQAGNTGGQFARAENRDSNIFRQSCLGYAIDDFIESYKAPVPDYIKIDVDGIEIQILESAKKTLANPHVKSVILEADITTQDYKDIQTLLSGHGFVQKESEPTVKGRDHMRNIVFAR